MQEQGWQFVPMVATHLNACVLFEKVFTDGEVAVFACEIVKLDEVFEICVVVVADGGDFEKCVKDCFMRNVGV